MPGYHDGGEGSCVPIGTCSNGFHDDGAGVCVINHPAPITAFAWEPADAQRTGFGDVMVDSPSSALVLKLKNTGNTTIGPVVLSINSAEVTAQTDTCTGKALAPPSVTGSSCTVALILAPTSLGAKAARITATASSITTWYDLTGNSVAPPEITVSPDSGTTPVAFPNTAITTKSDWVEFTVDNPSTVATTVVRYSLTGTEFELATGTDLGSCGATGSTSINPGETCTIKARFAPTGLVLGQRTGSLSVWTAERTVPAIAIVGTGTSPLVVSPNPYTFDPVALGQTGANVTFTVSNQGTSPTTVQMPTTAFANGGFALTSDTCALSAATTLAAGTSCTFFAHMTGGFTTATPAVGADPALAANQYPAQLAGKVTFTDGQWTQQLNLTGMVKSAANIQPFHFSGTGASATSVFLGDEVSQGTTSTPPVTVTFQNKGQFPASSITAQWCSGNSYSEGTCADTDAEFSLDNGTGQSTCLTVGQLDADATCTMTVRLIPQATTVTPKYLNLKYDDGTTTKDLVAFRFLGSGRTSTTPYLSPANITFPDTASGSISPPTTVTFHNPSAGSVNPTAIAIMGHFAVTGGTCALNAPVPPGGSCTLLYAFMPSDSGTDGAAGTVGRVGSTYLTASAVDYGVGLGGTMKRPAFLNMTQPGPFMQRTIAGPSTFAFNDLGSVVVGQTSPASRFTITNVGDVDTLALHTEVLGTAASSFQSSGCSGSLAAHASCTVDVTVAPTAVGWVGSSDTVLHVTDAQGIPHEAYSLALNAFGLNPALLTRSPATVAFDPQPVLSASCYQPVTLTNGASLPSAATEPLTVEVSSPDYQVSVTTPPDTTGCTYTPANQACAAFVKGHANNTTDTGLPGGASCDLWVRFVPQTVPDPAVINATLTASGGTDAGTVTVSMSGTAQSQHGLAGMSPNTGMCQASTR